jgi:hypothetical protein
MYNIFNKIKGINTVTIVSCDKMLLFKHLRREFPYLNIKNVSEMSKEGSIIDFESDYETAIKLHKYINSINGVSILSIEDKNHVNFTSGSGANVNILSDKEININNSLELELKDIENIYIKPTYDEIIYALENTHYLLIESVSNNYQSHHITTIMSNNDILKRLGKIT